MIICFSGTGNSRMVAEAIQNVTDEDIVMFAPGLLQHPEFIKLNIQDDRVVWVAPVHAWSLPKLCSIITKKAQLISDEPVKHHLILTCGDDIGYADNIWRKALKKRGWDSGSVYSVQMPNTFVGLKSFDVDSDELAQKKLDAVADRMDFIIDSLDNEDGPVTDVVRGSWPKFKTYVLNPLFSLIMSPSKFHTTDACIGCGRCARNCPVANITMGTGKPKFGNKCTLCFRCYHICHQHAIHYGKATANKGQYLCPGKSFTP